MRLKFIKLIVILAAWLAVPICEAQTYKIIDVNTENFPIVEARVLTIDQIINSNDFLPENVSIVENGKDIIPIRCKAPSAKVSAIPISIVLALDISASMEGHRIKILKESAKKILQTLPLELSEVSIATFNNDLTLNCDFTHDRDKLYRCVDKINVHGGTSYKKAFLSPRVGLVEIAKQGDSRIKQVIFISDGRDEVDVESVTKLATENNVIVNCITVGVPIGNQLKNIAQQTGGVYFDNLNSFDEISAAFKKIYFKTQVDCYGEVIWKANNSCLTERITKLILGRQTFSLKYKVPGNKGANIEVSASHVYFNNNTQNDVIYKPIYIKGNNIDVNITSIQNTNPAIFGIKSTAFPIRSRMNALKKLEFSFTPKDSLRSSATYAIKIKGCPDVNVNASSSGFEKLVITQPEGGEVYVRGEYIPIKWDGISKLRLVDFYYQIKGKKNWASLGSGIAYKKLWKAIALNDSLRIKGVVSGNISFSNLLTAPVSIIDTSFFQSAIYNKSGNEILSLSIDGNLKSWNAETGKFKNAFEHVIKGDYAYMPGFNRVVDVAKQSIKVFTNRNGLLMKKLSAGDHKNLTSLTHVKGKELYVTISDFNYILSQNSKYIDITSAPQTNYSIARSASKLHVFKTGQSKKEFAIRIDSTFQKSILHRDKAILAISEANHTQVYNLKTKSRIHYLNGEMFYQFSSCSQYVITHDALHYHFYDFNKFNRVFSVDKQNQFTISPNGLFIAQIKKDSVSITDILSHQTVWTKQTDTSSQAQFFPKSHKFLFLQEDSLVMIDLQHKNEATKIYCQTELIKSVEVSPDEKSLLVTCDNVIASLELEALLKLTDLGMEQQVDTDTTPYIKIVSPEPKVLDKITFPKQFVQTSVEKIFPNVIINDHGYPVFIDSIYVDTNSTCFSLVSAPGKFAIKPMDKTSVEMRFTPQKAGLNSGRLIVVSGNKKYICSLEGRGITQGFEHLSPYINFPEIAVNSSRDTIVPLLRNIGTEVLSLDGIRVVTPLDSNFYISPINPHTRLNPNDTLFVNITFSPTQRGRQNGIIQVRVGNQDWIKSSHLFGKGKAKRKVIIAGKTVHADTKEPMSAFVKVVALNSGRITHQQQTSREGTFFMEANTDINYSIDAQLDGYFSSSENINLTGVQTKDTIWVNIELAPIHHSSTVRLNNIFFESNKADLLDISKTEMLRVVALLNRQKQLKIEIHGHTDHVGSIESNKQLSKLRALAVKAFIIQNNISEDRLSIKYFGESQPVSDNNSEEGRKANRRVEVRFVKE